MSRTVKSNDHQMALDFSGASVRIEGRHCMNLAKVVNLNAYASSIKTRNQPRPALERLLQEAQKLRW